MAKPGRFTSPHGQLAAQKHPTASKIPSGGGLPQSQRVLLPHGGPAATSALPHLSPNTGPPVDIPRRRLLSRSPRAGRQRNRGGLSAEQLFISLCRGNLGLFMEIQMLLNNRCSSEKENFFCFGGEGDFFFFMWFRKEG